MPVRLSPSIPESSEARIEIIPLIDILFFLLAAFMLVSLGLIQSKNIHLNLPSASTGTSSERKDWIQLAVDSAGLVTMDHTRMTSRELKDRLHAIHQTNETLRISIQGDADVRHGDMVKVLDLVRSAGFQRVAFDVRSNSPGNTPTP